jgi:chromate transporter
MTSSPRALPPTAPEHAAVPFREAARFWLKLGCVSFGGPAGQIALMHRELVEQRRWISDGRFLHALNYCMVLPGPEAQQLATYLGWLMHRTRGGLLAGGLFVLPSLLLLIALSWLYVRFGQLPWVADALTGVKAAVVAIVLQAAHRIGTRTLRTPWLWGVAVASFLGIAALDAPFPLILLAAAAFGVVAGPRLGDAGAAQAPGAGPAAPGRAAIIGDDTPPPAHARHSLARLVRTLATGIGLWTLALGLLAWASGPGGTLTQMAGFFTRAALLTFGGAYAVLPYVYQGAVDQFHWLTGPQMIDGLALGETTPGPLIMVVAFVGFVGGWTHAAQVPPPLMAVAAACVATFFTFLPSFVFIFAGGPLIESTHGNLRLKAPLAAITASVVGVIVNLALIFGEHVFLPRGISGGADWPALAIFALAAVGLLRLRLGVVPVIGLAALAGLGMPLLRVAIG